MSEKVEHKPAREHHEPRTERTEHTPERTEERPREERPSVEKARGQSISHAVDVVEVVRRRFFQGKLTIKEVRIASEVLGEEGDTRNVSTIEIVLEKAA